MNISAGLGFSGYDEHGQPQFDLMENAEPLKVEVQCKCCCYNFCMFACVLAVSVLLVLYDRLRQA